MLEVKNVRCGYDNNEIIKGVSFNVEPGSKLCIVGPNGCGKSSVFDGMLFLQTSYQRIGSSNAKTYTYHSLEQFKNYNQNNIHIDFDTPFLCLFAHLIALGNSSVHFDMHYNYYYFENHYLFH